MYEIVHTGMSVAEDVRAYVEDRPYIQEALARDIVNYAALARQVQEEVGGGFEAVKVALRRIAEDIREGRGRRRETVRDVLAGTSIELKGGMQVCKTDRIREATVMGKTAHGYTLVQEQGVECPGERIMDQVLLTLKSPDDLEHAPGVLAYVLSLLAGRGINVTECISCREDTHIVVDAADATEAFSVLNAKLADPEG